MCNKHSINSFLQVMILQFTNPQTIYIIFITCKKWT